MIRIESKPAKKIFAQNLRENNPVLLDLIQLSARFSPKPVITYWADDEEELREKLK